MIVFLFSVVSASAQTVFCPSGGFSVTVPDYFDNLPISGYDDPELALHLSGGDINLTVYVSYGAAGSGFQILTGNETEYGSVFINGVEMFYARGMDMQGNWITYSWTQAANSVTIYFVWYGNDDTAVALISDIMSSIVFNR